MVSAKDLLIEALLITGFFSLSYFIFSQTSFPALGLLMLIPYFIVHQFIKRTKKIGGHLKEEFGRAGYVVLRERPLKLSEMKVEVKVSMVVTEPMTYSRWQYVRRFGRAFVLRNRKGEEFEWITEVTYHWDGRNEIKVRKKTPL